MPLRFRPAASDTTRTAVIALLISGSAMLCMSGCKGSGGGRSGNDDAPTAAASPSDIRGHVLLSLGETTGGSGMLTVVTLPIREPRTPSAQVEVAAANTHPGAIAVSADGRFAYVAQARAAGSTSQPGDSVAVIDLSNSAAPRVVESVFVGQGPRAVSLNAAGDLLAVVTGQAESPLVILPIGRRGAGLAGEPLAWRLSGLGDERASASSIAWHPSGRLLAVSLPESDEVAFYEVARSGDGEFELALAAPPTKVGPMPIQVAFANEGRVLTCLCNNRGEGGSVPIASGQLCTIVSPTPRGKKSDAKLMQQAATVADRVALAPGPVGLAISSRGTEAACTSVSGVDATPGRGGTLAVFDIDAAGKIVRRAETSLGAVPAGVAFDTLGRFVLVSQFGSLDPDAAAGEVAFWRLEAGRGRGLVQQDFFVGIGTSPHGSLIVR